MAFIDGMICAEMTNWIGKLLLALYNAIGDFGWTVVVFAVILRVILSPLDIWQKISSRKQAKKMERIRPQLEKLQRQYANDPQMLRQKQSELQKKEKIHMFTSCIPMIITLVLFFFIWDGFRALVSYENEVIVEKLLAIYNENVGKVDAATLNQMLVDGYDLHSFLWVKNIFMSDIGTNVIPSLEQYLSTINAAMPDVTVKYETLVGPAMEAYNKTGTWDFARWNGYFVLPVLSIATSFLTTKMLQSANQMPAPTGTAEQQKSQQATMKVMNYVMPLMLGVFAIMYSAAFALYYFISNVMIALINITFTLIYKQIEKKNAANGSAIVVSGGKKR